VDAEASKVQPQDLGLAGGRPEVAREGQPGSGPHRRSAEGGHDGNRNPPDGQELAVELQHEVDVPVSRIVPKGLEPLEVPAGRKSVTPGPLEDDGPAVHVVHHLLLQLPAQGRELGPHLHRKGVVVARAVEGDGPDHRAGVEAPEDQRVNAPFAFGLVAALSLFPTGLRSYSRRRRREGSAPRPIMEV
jgi:hypothetical protein